jgi:hypothetical protein
MLKEQGRDEREEKGSEKEMRLIEEVTQCFGISHVR